jgi:hypothetical protein
MVKRGPLGHKRLNYQFSVLNWQDMTNIYAIGLKNDTVKKLFKVG